MPLEVAQRWMEAIGSFLVKYLKRWCSNNMSYKNDKLIHNVTRTAISQGADCGYNINNKEIWQFI